MEVLVVSIPLEHCFESWGTGLIKVEEGLSSDEEVWHSYLTNNEEVWCPYLSNDGKIWCDDLPSHGKVRRCYNNSGLIAIVPSESKSLEPEDPIIYFFSQLSLIWFFAHALSKLQIRDLVWSGIQDEREGNLQKDLKQDWQWGYSRA